MATIKPFLCRVYAKNFVGDFFQSLKNIIGGRLKGYEVLIDTAIKETTQEFRKLHPKCKKYSITIKEFTQGAIMVLIQGE